MNDERIKEIASAWENIGVIKKPLSDHGCIVGAILQALAEQMDELIERAEKNDEIAALEEQLAVALEALEFYAPEKNYEIRVDPMTSSLLFPSGGIFKDNGERARQAIKTIGSE